MRWDRTRDTTARAECCGPMMVGLRDSRGDSFCAEARSRSADSPAQACSTRVRLGWEPGIAPSGLFWTIPIARSAIDVDPGSGQARLHATKIAVSDYHDFFNAVFGGGLAPLPSHVSFDLRWSGDGGRQKTRDHTFGFTGHYVTGATTVAFT